MQTEAAERAGACDLAAKDPAKTSDAPTNTAARDAWKVVSTLYDTFVGKLTVPDAAGRLPLANLAAEIALRDFIKSGMLLVLKPHRLGGSFVTRKTLWTLLGTNPFTVAGGALLSCALFDGSGNMTHAAILPALSEHYPLNHVKLKIDYEMYLAAR